MPNTLNPQAVLKDIFGYDQFRPLQRQVIENVLARHDTLVVMPTGGGKSICYQIPALIFEGLTVVVSPLIALMKDQVDQLAALGFQAVFLNSSLSAEEYQANVARIYNGEVKLLYISPEGLFTGRLFNLLSSIQMDCLTIDEAHCISEWGHDFRPEYRQLIAVRQRFPQAVCLALTATATPRVRQDIKACLGFQDSNEFVASFNRPNLLIEVQPKVNSMAQTLQLIRRFPDQSGIVYCFSRNQVDSLAATLASEGLSVRPYHAGLEDELRKQNQELFIRDDVQIIVATIAFGMGINKPNVRFVIHYDLPKSLEGYYQEIGRAGRDGLPAHCLLLYTYGDVAKQRRFIIDKEEPERSIAEHLLEKLVRYAEAENVCRRVPLLAYFGEEYQADVCDMCDHCLGVQELKPNVQVDITVAAQKFLSCVKRTGECFGTGHVVDVLCGSKRKEVYQFGHDKLTTYGIGKELNRQQWRILARLLVQQGLLEVQIDRYNALKLTEKAYQVLKNKAIIHGGLQPELVRALRNNLKAGIEFDRELFALLRQKRKALADAAHLPPYVIFSDRTLVEMATYYPMSPESMSKITGVGQVKLNRYGEIFIKEIRLYCVPRGIKEKDKPAESNIFSTIQSVKPVACPSDRKARYVEVAEAYNTGETIQHLVEQYQVQPGTILDHLAKYAQEGHQLRDVEGLLAFLKITPEVQETAMALFEQSGTERLKPVFEQLNGSASYDDLKMLRIFFLNRQSQAK